MFRLSLDALLVLDAIARRGSFAAAAEEVHRTTSTLSYTVQKLERDLGVHLFDRSGHRAELTEHGRLLLAEGRELLDQALALERRMRTLGRGWEPTLRLCVNELVGLAPLYALVRAFQDEGHPTRLRIDTGVLGGQFPPGFLAEARTLTLPVAPELMVAGDFDHDGHPDLALAQRGDRAVYLLRGGRDGFGSPEKLAQAGAVDALAAGHIDQPDGFADLAIAVSDQAGASLRIHSAGIDARARVQALPEEGRPASFSGAIGRFTVEASASPAKVTVGDPVTLTVKVSGKGNFDRVSIPAMESGADWKTYPASSKFEPTDALGTSGRKISEQAVVPLTAKVQAVPARPFSYFDPDKHRYVELATQPVALTIEGAPRTGAAGGSATTSARTAKSDGERAAAEGEQWELAPNQITAGAPADTTPVATQPWFLGLQLLPLAALAAGTLWARRRDHLRADPAHHRRLAARRRVDEETEAMQRAASAGDTAAFFAAARRAVQERLARDPDREAASLTLPELTDLVGDDAAVRDELRAIVGRADAITYSGERMPPGQLGDWQKRVAALLQKLDAPKGRQR